MRDRIISVFLAALLLFGVAISAYAVKSIHSFFSYDADPVMKTIKETVKSECLIE